jgi:hypothetical protein
VIVCCAPAAVAAKLGVDAAGDRTVVTTQAPTPD